jgi:hypothetical protein
MNGWVNVLLSPDFVMFQGFSVDEYASCLVSKRDNAHHSPLRKRGTKCHLALLSDEL